MKLEDTIINGKISSPKFTKYILTEEWNTIKAHYTFCETNNEIVYCHINKLTEVDVKCVCGNKRKFGVYTTGYRKFCSRGCANKDPIRIEKILSTKEEIYGVRGFNNIEKRNTTNLEKYGDENFFKTETYKTKNKDTLLEKYGVDNISQITSVKEKKKGRCGNPDKIKKINLTKKLADPIYSKLLDKIWLEEQYKEKTIVQISEEIGIAFSTINNYLILHGIERNNWKFRSGMEQEIVEFIESFDIKCETNVRNVISPREIDILVREKNLAIEVNGLYWHSINSLDDNTKENINYHLDKTNNCESVGLNLLHITDKSWNEKKEIWKSVIQQKLGFNTRIFARKCKINKIHPEQGMKFVGENHLQGSVNSGEYIGLFYDGELVSVFQYGKSRFSKKYDWEILRFCSKLNYSVVGGFSRLLKNSGLTGKIVSYANRSWSNGNLYKETGFILENISAPNYWYWKGEEFGNRIQFQKHKLKNILDNYNELETEFENMINNGYSKYCDSGNLVFSINLNNTK